jgi:hypothetical protein
MIHLKTIVHYIALIILAIYAGMVLSAGIFFFVVRTRGLKK